MANVGGVALLGLVACVAAGALESAPAIFLPWFFVAVCLGAVAIGLCRFFSENCADRICVKVGERTVQLHEPLRADDSRYSPGTIFNVQLCLLSVLMPTFVLVFGIWTSIATPTDAQARALIAGAFVCPVLTVLMGFLRWSGRRRSTLNGESRTKVQSRQPETSARSAQIQDLTYARLLRIYGNCAERAKVIGLAHLGQVACIAAGAFSSVSAFISAAFFTAVILSTAVLGLYRLSCEQASKRIERDIDAGAIQLPDSPFIDHVAPVIVLDVNVFLRCMTVPSLIFFVAICGPLFDIPTRATSTLVVVFLGYWLFDYFMALRKISRYLK